MAIFLLCLCGLTFIAGFSTFFIAESGIAFVISSILLIGAAVVRVSEGNRKILVEICDLLKKKIGTFL